MKQWQSWAGGLSIVILVASAGFLIEKSSHVNADAVAIVSAQKSKADAEYQATLRKMNDNRAQLARLDKYEEKVAKLTASISKKSERSIALDREISQKHTELESLTRGIRIAAKEPTVIPAGHHPVGTYVRPGRYSATGSSNFVVYGADGDTKVNTILGGGDFGVDCYVCDLEEGDTIKTESRTTLTPLAD